VKSRKLTACVDYYQSYFEGIMSLCKTLVIFAAPGAPYAAASTGVGRQHPARFPSTPAPPPARLLSPNTPGPIRRPRPDNSPVFSPVPSYYSEQYTDEDLALYITYDSEVAVPAASPSEAATPSGL
jgi:hypothetical protein